MCTLPPYCFDSFAANLFPAPRGPGGPARVGFDFPLDLTVIGIHPERPVIGQQLSRPPVPFAGRLPDKGHQRRRERIFLPAGQRIQRTRMCERFVQ